MHTNHNVMSDKYRIKIFINIFILYTYVYSLVDIYTQENNYTPFVTLTLRIHLCIVTGRFTVMWSPLRSGTGLH